jgi:hypothetical protein
MILIFILLVSHNQAQNTNQTLKIKYVIPPSMLLKQKKNGFN